MSAYLIPAAAKVAAEAVLGPLNVTQVRNGVTYYVAEWVNAPGGTDAAVVAVGGTVYPNGTALLAALPPVPTPETALVAATRILIAPTVRTLDAQPALAQLAPLFPEWRAGEAVKVADFRTYNGAVFECVQAHTTQFEPPVVPALWKQYRAPGAQWVQPLGNSSYPVGAIVTDAGKTWRSIHAANVWRPPTQWVEVTP